MYSFGWKLHKFTDVIKWRAIYNLIHRTAGETGETRASFRNLPQCQFLVFASAATVLPLRGIWMKHTHNCLYLF